MSRQEPTRRTILLEAAIYALMFLLAGALFVAIRAVREGPRVVNFDVTEHDK